MQLCFCFVLFSALLNVVYKHQQIYAWMTVSDATGLYLDMKSVCEVEAAEKSLMNDEQFWNENVELSCHVMYVLECKDDTTAVAVI